MTLSLLVCQAGVQCLRFFDCQMYYTDIQLRMLMTALASVQPAAR